LENGGFAFINYELRIDAGGNWKFDALGNSKFDPFGNNKNYELGVGGEGNSEIDF
jgi:hypothetical protein